MHHLREILTYRTYMGLSTVTQRKKKRSWKRKIGLSKTMKKNLRILLRKCIRGKEMLVRTPEAVLTHSTVRKSWWFQRTKFLPVLGYHHKKRKIMWGSKWLGRLLNQELMRRSPQVKRKGSLLVEVKRALLPRARLRGLRSRMLGRDRHRYQVIPLIWKIGGLGVKKIIMKGLLTL